MANHLILPGVRLEAGLSHDAYLDYLVGWREQAVMDADAGIVAASICQQATLIDLVLDGRPTHDWLSVMEDLLSDGGRPLAYSVGFGERLFGFNKQFVQSTIHSIHSRWWVELLSNPGGIDHGRFADLILKKKTSGGLIVDEDVSPTVLRHRIQSEITMSAAMGTEILSAAGRLTDNLKNEVATSLSDPRKVPPLGYMISEQFRLSALRILGCEEQFPVGIDDYIFDCEAGLDYGWGDFSVASKVDSYMGTAKRTLRDKQVHSPLVACHVLGLVGQVHDSARRDRIHNRMTSYSRFLAQNPLRIPAFQMRDVIFPFGADLTPIEAMCASHLIANCDEREAEEC